MTADGGRPPESGTRAYRLALEAHRREVDERVGRVEQAVGDVATAVAKLSHDSTSPPPSWHPDDLDDSDRGDWWSALEAWVDEVLRRWHPARAEALRPCWGAHRPAVAAVDAARLAWVGAYRGPNRRPSDPAAWLRDWLPALDTQLSHELGRPKHDEDTGPCAHHQQEETT